MVIVVVGVGCGNSDRTLDFSSRGRRFESWLLPIGIMCGIGD